jgi:flavin reductase (DIM6/NTAB) family NADH-FMN oxidoreductase RutF
MNDQNDSLPFRKACGLWASGVSVITTINSKGIPFGLTMNAVTSLSLEPAMLLVCVDKNSDTLAPMLETLCFCINVLSNAQQELSGRFAKKGDNKFEGVNWSAEPNGAPVLDGSLVSFTCSIAHVYEGGDHIIVCGKVEQIADNSSGGTEPLIYFKGGYREFRS